MLKVLGAGMPRTGTTSLCEALKILGYNAIDYHPTRIKVEEVKAGGFKVFDDVEAVTDAPGCFFFREIIEAYPDVRVILTVRDTQDWYDSIERHCNWIERFTNTQRRSEACMIHSLLFNTLWPNEFIWKRQFLMHNLAVMQECKAPLMLIDICNGDDDEYIWKNICDFLDKPVPDEPFPWKNKSGTRRKIT